MRRFLVELTKFFAIQTVIFGACAITFFGYPNKHHYLAASQDKEARLKSLSGPRMIIVGDSGAAYGIYSPILEERFPDYAPVNMALMAAVGLPTMLAEVRNELREGDVVVIILAYQHFDRYVKSWEYFNYLAYRPDMMFSKPLRETTEMTEIAFFFFHRAIHSLRRTLTIGPHVPRDPPMHREGFNEYGDLVSHHVMTPTPNLDFSMADLSFSQLGYTETIIKDLNAFEAKAKKRGASVYFLFPAISESTWNENGEIIQEISDYVVRELDFPALNRPDDVIYADSDFFDTFYHLTGDAAKRRTSALADDLEPQLPSNQ